MNAESFPGRIGWRLHRWSGIVVGVVCAVSILLFGVVTPKADTANTVDCTASPCCALVDCTGNVTLPTAEECEADDCECAQWIECYLRNQDPSTNWPLIPDGDIQINRNFFPSTFLRDAYFAG